MAKKTFVFNRLFLAMAEYSSKLELCSFGLTKSFIPLGFVKNTKVFPLGFVIFELNIPLGFIRNDNVCARRAQKPSLLGLCRAAAKRLLKTNI